MNEKSRACAECEGESGLSRRDFMKVAGAAAALAASTAAMPRAASAHEGHAPPDTIVKQLYDSLTEKQRKVVCFDWDYVDPQRGLLRTRVANNWQITPPAIKGEFYTADQQHLVRAIFEGMVHPSWHAKFDKQLQDDIGGFGNRQSIAIFGKPGEGKFEFVLTGRHMTLRCDGHSVEHVAFGGPIFYGHAAQGFNEKPDHPGNIFWPQALAANEVYKMLDGKQRKTALIAKQPAESAVEFRGPQGPFPGIPVKELSADQKEQLQKTLRKLLEPYRPQQREDVNRCLKVQGGLDGLSLAFYQENDIGNDGVWDVWRLEGPSFVWHFRGEPHVHVWVNIADTPTVKLNA
jgi:hypothetical protein